jgi:hypothetical protein
MRRLLLAALVSLASAQPSPAAETCARYGTISVANGQYVVQNNVWGASTAQCVNVPDTSQTAFTVSSSAHNQGSVAAYPSIYKGCHWGACTSGSGLPVVYSNVSSAPFSWSTTRASSGTWNIAAEAWMSASSSSSNGYNGGAEIMIWLDYAGMQPSGSQVGTASIAGATWQVWYSNIGWNYVAYRRVGAAGSISADLKAFIDDAISRGYAQRSWYLHVLEAGTELMAGGQGFRTNSFSFSVQTGGGGSSSSSSSGGGTSYTLTVSKAGSGSGTVTSSTGGINCGSTCSAAFASGTSVTLTAAPSSGSTFQGWSNACTGTGTCNTTMTANRTAVATFNASGGSSSSSSSGGSSGGGSAPCSNPVTFSGASGNFGTTGAVCLRTSGTVNGWGCSSFDGRTVKVNAGAASSTCGAGPFPLAKSSDGYTYFTITAGTYPWATLYTW